MKIYNSTEFVKDKSTPWIKLDVVSQWDYKTPTICYQIHNGITIFYSLNLCTPHFSGSWKVKALDILTDEMKTTLLEMGYTLK